LQENEGRKYQRFLGVILVIRSPWRPNVLILMSELE
jgi:hypothetical protein